MEMFDVYIATEDGRTDNPAGEDTMDRAVAYAEQAIEDFDEQAWSVRNPSGTWWDQEDLYERDGVIDSLRLARVTISEVWVEAPDGTITTVVDRRGDTATWN